MFALVSLFLTLTSRPVFMKPAEYMFTSEGCRHMNEEERTGFDTAMNQQLGGCTSTEYQHAVVFTCRDGGQYIYFRDRMHCEEAVTKYREHLEQQKK